MPRFTHDQIDKMFPIGTFGRDFDYGPIDLALGEHLVNVRDDDYQGDTRILLRSPEGKFAIYTYSWGSCHGCDFAQACGSVQEMLDYANAAYDNLKWSDRNGVLAELSGMAKDDFGWHDKDTEEFIRQCRAWFSEHLVENKEPTDAN